MSGSGSAGVGRRHGLKIGVAVMCLLLAAPAGASAVGRGLRERSGAGAAKPYFDSRVDARRAAVQAGPAGSAAERSARRELRQRLGARASIQVDALSGTARSVQRLGATLTGPAAGDRADVAMRWVRANRTALGLTAADVAALTLSDRSVDQASGFTYLRYRQFFRGIPSFDGGLRINLDRGGRILNVTGPPITGLSVPSVTPRLSGADAMRALQADVGVRRAPAVTSGPSGVRHVTRFEGGDFARLVLFDAPDGLRLAWHLTYRATSPALYDAVVDATTGRVLFRQNLTKFDADQTVFKNYPGAERDPNPAKAAANQPLAINFESTGWLPNGTTTLNGPNAHVFSDLNDDNAVNAGEEITRAPTGDFNDTFTPFQEPAPSNACDFHTSDPDGWPDPLGTTADCAWDPDTPATRDDNRQQSGVQAFYFVNVFHDHLRDNPNIAFNAASGAFEGTDKLIVHSLDGANTGPDDAHVNNANMSTPPDGESPTMQMFLFRYDPTRFFRFRNIDGDDDAGTVWHEYTHGLSNRLVTHGDGSGALGSPHAGAMGEAWSDWYALDFLHRQGLEIDAAGVRDVDVGIYTDATFTATRFEPIDCRPADTANERCPGGIDTGTGGYTFADFGHVAGAPEVHSDGEIWMQTLWDLRRLLGSDKAEQLVTQGMRLSPPEPSFLDMRNAIIAAEAGLGNTDRTQVWQVFTARGMGFFAGAADSSDVTPVQDFHMPPAPTAAKGRVAGTVTSADTGLPLPGVKVGFGGLTTDVAFQDRVPPATSAANGFYSLQAPAGTYGNLAYDRPGWDRVTARSLNVPANGTRSKSVALRRDWAASRGGASITGSDDTGADFGCGLAQLIDQSQGVGWSPFNPNSPDAPPQITGPPTATITLPQTIDIAAFGMDPGATCGDDETATTRSYRVETSADGVHFAVARTGTFTTADAGRLNLVRPTANANGVRFVRLTLLAPQSADLGESGRDFIDFSEFEVFGGPRNVLPSGSLAISASRVNPRDTVSFEALFTDPDSKITGYDWDFDGDGTFDRSTAGRTTSFAYRRGGNRRPRVRVNDFRGGAGTASRRIHVTVRPKLDRLRGATNGRARLRAVCDLRCRVNAKLRLSKKTAEELGLTNRTVGSLRRTVGARKTKGLTIRLTRKARRALRRDDRSRVKATLRGVARYPSDGRQDTARRRVTIKL